MCICTLPGNGYGPFFSAPSRQGISPMLQPGQAPSADAVRCAAAVSGAENARTAAISELEPSLASSCVAWELGAETGAGGSACRIVRSGTATRPFQPVPADMSPVGRVFAQPLPTARNFRRVAAPDSCKRACESIRGEFDAAKLLRGARLQSRCAGGLRGTWMADTGGKSGRRPGRHLQVEASGPGNAASVECVLAGELGAEEGGTDGPVAERRQAARLGRPHVLPGA